jgi:hypothetical protein
MLIDLLTNRLTCLYGFDYLNETVQSLRERKHVLKKLAIYKGMPN